MREAIGGYFPILMVLIFIATVSSFMAFVINYNKAFKMKDKIINVIERNENVVDSNVKKTISEYSKEISYNASSNYLRANCSGYELADNWCYKIHEKQVTDGSKEKEYSDIDARYVEVKTFTSIDIPFINQFLPGIDFFVVKGSTRTTRKIKR